MVYMETRISKYVVMSITIIEVSIDQISVWETTLLGMYGTTSGKEREGRACQMTAGNYLASSKSKLVYRNLDSHKDLY